MLSYQNANIVRDWYKAALDKVRAMDRLADLLRNHPHLEGLHDEKRLRAALRHDSRSVEVRAREIVLEKLAEHDVELDDRSLQNILRQKPDPPPFHEVIRSKR